MIDIKELRINSTVLFNDERVKITAIDYSEGEPFVMVDNNGNSWLHLKNMIKPIPLTEELLKELGFDKREIEDLPPYWRKDDIAFEWSCWDKWRVAINNSEYAYVEYLHEAETFVYLITKQELI